MKRRPLLAGVAASLALAGCSSSQSSGTDSPGSPGDSSGNTPGGPGPTRVLRSERGVTLQVEEYQLAQSVAIENGSDLENVDGAYYLLLRITSENQSDSPKILAQKEDLAIIAGGDEQESYIEIEQDFNTEEELRITAPVEGEVYDFIVDARSGVTTSGWVVFSLRNEDSNLQLSWTGESGQTPQEMPLDVDPGQLPSFEVRSIDAPDTAERYSPTEVTVSVANTGGSTGTFQGRLEGSFAAADVQLEIPAGEEAQTTVELPYPDTVSREEFQSTTYSIAGGSTTVDWQIPTREIGEAYETPGGLRLTVDELGVGDQLLTYKDYSDSYEPVTLYGYDQFVYARIISENTSDVSLPAATHRELRAVVDGDEIPVDYPRSSLDEGKQLRGDFQGRAYGEANLRSGGTQAGYLVYGIDRGYSREDARIRFDADSFDRDVPYFDLVVEWTV